MTEVLSFARPLPQRPQVSHLVLNLLVASYIMLVLNTGFWQRLLVQYPDAPWRAWIFGLGVWALTLLLLELLGPSLLQKPVAALMILIAAGAHYYEQNFGVLIDRDMVRNIFQTTFNESRHLITPKMIFSLLLTGALPVALLFYCRVTRVGLWHQLWRWPLGVVLAFVLMVTALYSNFKDYSAMLRERHEVMTSYQPGDSIVASLRYLREQWQTADPIAAPYGRDAKAGPYLAAAKKPVLLVIFAGETARAQNFGLDGYARDTTPELRKRDVINFSDATSCGTSTAVSLPCMFSALGKAGYSRAAALGQENLLDVLGHAGMKVQWWDNNTGDQNIAKRFGWIQLDRNIAPQACVEECTDMAFLPVIEQTLAGITEDTVLVLHMIGSHGPSYYMRYPEAQAAFKPDCRSAQFSDCSTAEIVNAYDNSIRQTDRVLAATIDLLQGADQVIPAMVYLSDHGESLGENGLYLHAAPNFMAPPEQVKVPMLLWLSAGYKQAMGLDSTCLQAEASKPVSHDNLFHTVLGLLDIQTAVRQPGLDLASTCRKSMLG